MPIGLIILQYVHVLFAATLLGSALFIDLVLWPTLLRRPALEAKDFFESSFKTTSILMGVSSGITFSFRYFAGHRFREYSFVE
jgi:uncharacterized membrane protein